jgi:putative hemolysin
MSDILIILFLILLNGVFAMAELAIASSKRLRLQEMAGAGRHGAQVAIDLADNPSGFLSTVQVGITLISIFNGAFGEASLVERLTPKLAAVPLFAPYARQAALGIVIVAITFVSIVLGELVPKRIAMQYPEGVAAMVARPLRRLSRLMTPFVATLSLVTELIMRLLRLHEPKDAAPTAQEISGMLKEGSDAGVLAKTEYDIARRAMRLDAQRLSALMTPRGDLQFIDLDDSVDDNLAKIAASPFSRFPVFSHDRSNIVGIVHAGDLLEQAIKHNTLRGIDIAAAAKPVLYVPATVTARGLLEQFRQHGAEIALVVDEHGLVQGLVTVADLMGALVGGMPGVEAHESGAVQREDGSWLMDGAMSLEQLRELLGTAMPFPDEAAGAYQTLAGFVLHQLGRIPAPSDHFQWDHHRFEVVDMDGNRVDRVLVSAIA